MFTKYPSYNKYRTLRLTTPRMVGEDCFALQTALLANGFDPHGLDGIIGPNTETAIKAAQFKYELIIDGLAGGKTQEALGRKLSNAATSKYHVANGLMRGQLEHESSWRLGNYSDQRPDTSYDAGVAQMNTARFEPSIGFDVPKAINELGKEVSEHFTLFAGVKDLRRRWSLASGAWNAPAYACYIAREEGATLVPNNKVDKPGVTARAKLEVYMTEVTAYLDV